MKKVMSATAVAVLGTLGFSAVDANNNQANKTSAQIRAERIAASPNFENGRVKSQLPSTEYEGSMRSLMWNFFMNRDQLKPTQRLPHAEVNLTALHQGSKELRITWLGHSSLFIDVDNTQILVDPVFEYASPWIAQKLFNRNVDAPIARKDLPVPDAIVISHDHYDHLEKSTVKFFKDKGVRFIVPLGVGKHLESWGVQSSLIEEFDWWESTSVNGVLITAAPANHNSGRTGVDGNSTLFNSWAIKSENGSVFYSGDTAYGPHFKQIGERLGPFDISFIEVAANVKPTGGYPVENWGHMQAQHSMQAHLDVKAKKLFPVHWSTFELFAHVWDEPINDIISEADKHGAQLVTDMPGSTIYPRQSTTLVHWWHTPQFELASVN